ncbi:MAG: CBS domain-containing protein [Candidatus Thiodiazotropha sp.]|nr:CBS domain-containing protein [Candidatus Thiodiazotropha sp.]MCM8883617.1 CBS domain-containing protein [Candidatus Thiodiazotropha sp.]MCM8920603.1 CBS domain-containing protein [Candidatus Thiodiazotropha sp.]MCU7875569.1 CBS domain-containing protein [Candidatus Thiodiazotropha sp. (ex Lucinoma borealis)]
MKIKHVSIPTKVARPGMQLGEVMMECVEKRVPGIPYMNTEGKLSGRFSVRHLFLLCCIPQDVIQGAHLLGDDIEHLDFPHIIADELMAQKVDDFVFADFIQLSPNFQAIKALAIMEQYNTSYLFVTEGDNYQGVVTRLSIARAVVTKACCVE